MNTSKNNNETRVVCPRCGTEIAIPEAESFTVGITIGKNSGLGTVVLPEAKGCGACGEFPDRPLTYDRKIEKLRKAGVDVSQFFTIDGSEKVYKAEGGRMKELDENDPTVAMILSSGDSPVYRLFRRWIMAQVFRMLDSTKGFTGELNGKGYEYQWKVTVEELRVQAKIAKDDPICFEERNRWYNRGLATDMADDYLCKLDKETKMDGRIHWRIGNGYRIPAAEYRQWRERMKMRRDDIQVAETPKKLYEAVRNFWNEAQRYWRGHGQRQSSEFQSAYKGAGGYFTMQNLIRFHKCRFSDNMQRKMDEAGSLKELERLAKANVCEGWKMLGVLKEFLKYNKINIAKKRAEWSRAKAGRV